MSNLFDIAIVDADSVIGSQVLELLPDSGLPFGEIYPVAVSPMQEQTILFQGDELAVLALDSFDFSRVDLVFFAGSTEVSAQFARQAASCCGVIDFTPAFVDQDDIPQVVVGVNDVDLQHFENQQIVVSPHSSSVLLAILLKALQPLASVKALQATCLHSVSTRGKAGVQELAAQTAKLLNGLGGENKTFSQQVAFNLLPDDESSAIGGYSAQEMQILKSTQKVLHQPGLPIQLSSVFVPVFYGDSVDLNIEFNSRVDLGVLESALAQADGIEVFAGDNPLQGATPQGNATGSDEIWVSRIRASLSSQNGVNLWVVSDNARKGAALNGIRLAELLIKSYL